MHIYAGIIRLAAPALLSLMLHSCRTAAPSQNSRNETAAHPHTAGISGQTRAFLKELRKEKSTWKNSSAYTPSNHIIRRYGLIETGSGYVLRGLLRTSPEFDPQKLPAGITVTRVADGIYSVTSDLEQAESLPAIPGITWFELAAGPAASPK